MLRTKINLIGSQVKGKYSVESHNRYICNLTPLSQLLPYNSNKIPIKSEKYYQQHENASAQKRSDLILHCVN